MTDPFGGASGRPAVGRDTVLTVDNVALELPLASAATRSLAAFVDYLVLVTLVLLTLGVVLGVLLAVGGEPGLWALAFGVLGFFFLHWTYFAGSEIAMDGQTLGKRLLGLRVVTREGGTPSAGAVVLRTVLRDVDLIMGILWMIFDRLGRRLGDLAGSTLVVHDHPGGAEEGPMLHRLPPGWGAAEAATVEALLARGQELADGRGEILARRVRQHLSRNHPEMLAGTEHLNSSLAALRIAFEAMDAA